MLEAIFWSAVATGTILVGMALAYRSLINKRWTALIMAFGAGAIISAAAYQLILGAVSESQDKEWLVALGLAIGALTFYFADRWVDKMGGADRNDMDGAQSSGSGTGFLLGSLLDGVPESLVLGLSLVHTSEISMAYIFAVAISNIPQGLGGTAGMLESGWPEKKITNLWLAVCGASIVAAALGYGLGAAFSGVTGALVDAFAGGALLVMLTDSLLPEAFKHGRKETGLSLVIGFGVAVALSTLQLS